MSAVYELEVGCVSYEYRDFFTDAIDFCLPLVKCHWVILCLLKWVSSNHRNVSWYCLSWFTVFQNNVFWNECHSFLSKSTDRHNVDMVCKNWLLNCNPFTYSYTLFSSYNTKSATNLMCYHIGKYQCMFYNPNTTETESHKNTTIEKVWICHHQKAYKYDCSGRVTDMAW